MQPRTGDAYTSRVWGFCQVMGARISVGWELPSVVQTSKTQQPLSGPASPVLGVYLDTQVVDRVEQRAGGNKAAVT